MCRLVWLMLADNLGASIVHESGHWLSLLHPFQVRAPARPLKHAAVSQSSLAMSVAPAQDGCTEPNDGIDDTPEQSQPDYYCVPTNSCPNRPAGQGDTDPIHNFMARTPNACPQLLPRFADPRSVLLLSAASHYSRRLASARASTLLRELVPPS